MSAKLHLGYHYHVPALQTPDGIRTAGFCGGFIDTLAQQCRQLTCLFHSPRADEMPYLDYVLKQPNIDLIDLGKHTSVWQRHLHWPQIRHKLLPLRNRFDAVLLRGPSPLLPKMAHFFSQTPLATLIVGSYASGTYEELAPIKRMLVKRWSAYNHRQQQDVCRQNLTFVNSHALYKDMSGFCPHIVEVQTTTLGAEDFFERDDTCESQPIRLLYVGRISQEKGLRVLIDAFEQLVRTGDYFLEMVGNADPPAFLASLQESIRARHLQDRVVFHGYKPMGDRLFEHYREADILVLPSFHEGFPRVLWEAMSYSLPVVATSVGSIPYYVSEVAEIVPPREIDALRRGIERVVEDASTRRQRIAAARLLARSNTLESTAAQIVTRLEQWAEHVQKSSKER